MSLDRVRAAGAGFEFEPLPNSSFGALARLAGGGNAHALVARAEAQPELLPQAFYAADGLLVLPGLRGIAEAPELLLRLSRLFGSEVENYNETLTAAKFVHPSVPEIFIVSNIPPAERLPPPRPEPPRTEAGGLPTRFPHRRGWHTDQSYRRPPPDISLFHAVIPAPLGQGQTLYANGIAAYESLAPRMQARIETHEGLHVNPGTGRSEPAVRAGETPRPLEPHQQPQAQPVVRTHPVTGHRAIYLCEAGQMDWLEGPFVGMAPGPDGDGAKLLYQLMAHLTGPRFTYVHDWSEGDLVIYDNRSLVHAATWFDADKHRRLMWRTTVRGNPGAIYAGEKNSWIAAPKRRT